MTGTILSDMEARAIQQIAGLLEAAAKAMETYKLAGALLSNLFSILIGRMRLQRMA